MPKHIEHTKRFTHSPKARKSEKEAGLEEIPLHTEPELKTIAVVGLGYVGLPLALLIEAKGRKVIGIDADAKKVADLKRRYAPHLSTDEQRAFEESRMDVEASPERIREADAVVVCVPTPVNDDFTPDLAPLKSASIAVGKNLRKGALVVIESTVNPGCCEEAVLPLIEEHSGLKAEEDFYFAHCPERINPGDPKWSVHNIPRVVGANSGESLARARALYESVLDAEVHPMQSIREAEAVKMIENTFRDINIAYVNELAMSFDRLGIDVTNVIRAASSKPFGFMPHYPGCGVGGHCIPVDPYYLMEYAARHGFEHKLIKQAREINNGMPRHTVDLLEDELSKAGRAIDGARIALLGLSYKANIPDLRESPALEILEELHKRGARAQVFDPHVETEEIESVRTLEDALAGADAVLLATDHHAFANLHPDDLRSRNIGIIVDGRNFLSKELFREAGIAYRGIGR